MNQKWVMTAVASLGVAVVLVLYGLFAYVPLARKAAATRQAMELKQQELKTAEDLLRRTDEFQARAAQVKMEMARLDARLPDKPSVPELLKAVTQAATQSGIKEFQFAPQPTVAKEGFDELPVRLTVHCGYHALGSFLDHLARLPRLVSARTIQLTAQDKTGRQESLTAEIEMVTYVRHD